MTSTYINEIRKKQKDYLGYLFNKFEKYSNEKFLHNLITKSINEISLYPFQDVNDNEVVDDINDFINELTINAQYKKKSVFKHLCEKFLSDNFYIYNENDRYELKYVILKLLFLISESSKNENIKQVDLLFDKYFCIKDKYNEEKEKKGIQHEYLYKLNMNEKLALDEINNYNIQEQEKYLKEFYFDDNNYVNYDNYDEKRHDNLHNYDENKYTDDIYTQCSSASEQYEMSDKKSKEKTSDEDMKMNNQEAFEENSYIDFYQTQNSYIENYMKRKSELAYENVIKKIYECIYTYPHYEDNTNKIIQKKTATSRRNNDISNMPQSDKCDSYNKNNSNEGTKSIHTNHSNNEISFSSDDDIFISMKRRQKKKKKYQENMYKLKPKEQYFFNDINIYDEETYENNDFLENENNIIYETDIYNLRNVFFTNTKSNNHEEKDEHVYDTNGNVYKNKEKKELSNQMYDKKIYINDINQVDNKSNDNIYNNNNNNLIIDEVTQCKNQEINKIHNKFFDHNIDINIKKNNRRTHKSNRFYVSESFIIKEILMILSLNCPIKFKNNFYMNCSDFLFNKKMDKQKIKDDFLFYINIEKRKECYQKINGKPYRKKKKLFFEKSNDKNKIFICYHAVIKKMMNMQLYNIKKKIFNNYIKNLKKITIKLFYINMFICIIENFRNFLNFLPYDLYDIFNYIMHVKENVDHENGKENNTFLSFLFNNMINVNINSNNNDNNDNNNDNNNNNNNNNNNEMYNIYINSSCNNYNNYCEGNFLNCFLSSLKNIYSEWITVINILYNYHTFIILRQYDIVSVTKEQIVDLVKQIEHIKILKYLKLRHFINFRRKKNRKDRKYNDNIRNKINNKENNNIYTNDNINMTSKTNISNNSCKNNNNYYNNYIDQEVIEEISSFRSLSLIRLNYLIINYLFMWDNIYDFINVILSYSLYDSNVYSYHNNHKMQVNNKKLYSTAHYDNAKKFCVCYDMFILYWRNSQILNNKYLEKVFRYFLDELNIYYSKYINDWIKKGQIFDKFNEFFICPEKNEHSVYPYNDTTLNIKTQNEFVLCPEFFDSFVFYIISLGNNIRLHMKINNEKNNIDYVDYYVREELNRYEKISENNSDMYNNTYNKLHCFSNDDHSNELFFFGEYTNNIKILHVNTLNSYYNLENLKHEPNSSLDILCKFLKKNKNKYLPYFNKNVLSLNISYDIYIKKYLQEQFFEIYYRSNRIFLYSLMKYCYLLEYFSCLRSLVFLEINDYILPFFEFIFKENCFLIIDERNMNSIFRQCVYNNTNITIQNKNKFITTDDGNYTCSSFLHKKFTLIHMKIILSKILDMENHKKYKRKRIFLHMQNDNKIVQNGDEYNNRTKLEERNYKKLNNGKNNILLKENDEDTQYIDNYNIEDDIIYENYDTYTDKNFLDNSKHNTIEQHDYHYNIKCSSDLRTHENLRKYSICEKLTNTFYKEEIISNIFKKFYLKLKVNTLYNNNVNVISYRNLIIEFKGEPFVNFLFDSKCLEKYSAIFSYFLEIKKSFHILNLVYIFYKYIKSKKPSHFDNYYMILSSLCVLKYKIYFFINTLYTYFQWILTYSWNRFLINLSESKSLTHIKKNHEFYINFLIEAILIPIKTSHEELYNYYINDEYNKDNDIYKEYEQKFFNSSIRKNDEDSNISLSIHHMNNISSNNNDTNLLINNNSTNIIIEKSKTNMYVHQKQKHNNITHHIVYKERNAFLNKNSMDKQFLLNELFANNILNIIFIPSQIYEILLKLSKFLNIKFDLNFDNAYYNIYENYYKDDFKTSEDYENEYNEYSENDMNDECNENSDNDIIKIKNNLLNTSQNNNNNNSNLKKLETEQFIFSIKNDIKALTKIFEINYSEFMKKLNIISFNAEDNSFFGPNKNYELFNHIIRLDKNILKKISILEYMLSYQSYNNPTDVIN